MLTIPNEYRLATYEHVLQQIANSDYDYNLSLTLNFSLKKKGMSLNEMNLALRHWTHKANKSVISPNWKKQGRGLRYFAFAELTESYPHFHLIIGAPLEPLDKATTLMANKWLGMEGVDSKTYSVEWNTFNEARPLAGWVWYCTKEITKERQNYWNEAQILAKEW